MFYLQYLVLIFITLLLESTVGVRLTLFGIRPDFSLALVVFAGLSGGGRGGVIIGFVVGLVRGCADPAWFGLDALLLSLVGFAAGSTSPMVNREHPFVQAGLIALLLLGHDLLRILITHADALLTGLLLWLKISPLAALYTGVLVSAAVAILPRIIMGRSHRAVS